MFGDLDSREPEAPDAKSDDTGRPATVARTHWRLLSRLYGAVARQRRAWYQRHPGARRRLDCPVVSVGNLTVGGSGKTPVVAHVCRILLEMGERPSVLSRGYGRRDAADGVVTVRDPERIHADLARAGDEPLMLARALDGVTVLVSSSRYLAGRVAEQRFGCTVHVLDDGFQHLELDRSVDLLVGHAADLRTGLPLPAGRLREPTDVARNADALIVFDDDREGVEQLAESLAVPRAFSAVRMLEDARLLEPMGRQVPATPSTRALALAGIARPDRFFADVRAQGWTVAGQLAFRDHHRFSRSDIERILDGAKQVRAELILTTEKDAVRLRQFRPFPIAVAWLPLEVAVQPRVAFREWLHQRLTAARRVDRTQARAEALALPRSRPA